MYKTLSYAFTLLILASLTISACQPGKPAAEPTLAPATQAPAMAPTTPPSFLRIPDVYSNQDRYLNQQVTIEGYFSLGGPAYLLDDYQDALTDGMILIQNMLVLTGNIPSAENEGALLMVTGKLEKYNNQYPDYIDDRGEFLALDVQSQQVMEKPAVVAQDLIGKENPEEYLKQRIEGVPNCLYVLIVTGSTYTPPGTGINFVLMNRHWNNTLFAYQTAVRYGARWIQVLYSNGAPPAAFPGMLPGTILAANLQAATRDNLTNALTFIENNMPEEEYCQLWIITDDHGAGWLPPNKLGIGPGANYMDSGFGRIDGAPPDGLIPEGDLHLGDENCPLCIGIGNVVDPDQGDDVDEGLVLVKDPRPGVERGIIYDDSFASELAAMRGALNARGVNYDIFILMGQCFSGGFIADLWLWPAGPLFTNIATASSENQLSWTFGGNSFTIFLYYFISALNGAGPLGLPMPGLPAPPVTWRTAFNFAGPLTTAAAAAPPPPLVQQNPQFR